MYLVQNEPLCNHTTFRIGGPAAYYARPENIGEVLESIRFANDKQLPFVTIGRGSNVLFEDRGYSGVVIEIGGGMEKLEFLDDCRVRAEAGVRLSTLAVESARHSLTGLEFAGGIPGTVGGAVVMNAGAYGGEIKDCIVSATVLDKEGEVRELSREQLELGYRTSRIAKQKEIVLAAEFRLEMGEKEQILSQMKELNTRRREKQPLEFASAGSTFKRPPGHFAGKLIEDAGLKGCRIGDAQVSEKHCGFVINRGHATAEEVVQLIQQVQDKVYEMSGVRLEPEVKMIKAD